VRIGELAAASGVSVRALRYYEEQDLLHSERSAGGQRTYSEAAIDRVRMIQQLYAAGLSSKVILSLLPCVVTGRASAEILERLTTERDKIEAQITDLTSTLARLDDVIKNAALSA
jgi:DNA-binding transcriptional MerR regulator